MKRIAFFLLLAILAQSINAQNIGIGTSTPNPKALVDISSTTKGLLIPSMTSLQRTLIPSPPNGLMVYDTDQNQFYHFDDNGSTWRKLLNSTYWNQSASRNWIYNLSDSIGIGTSAPTQRLDVNGNIRSRDDLLADGRVIAGGIVSGSSLQTAGNLVANGIGVVNGNFTTNGNLTANSNLSVDGTSLLTGDVTTNGDLIVNNSGATLQLRNGSNVNKGFFQLSGENVRMGTNSGNSTGNLVIRMNGNDRVQINSAGSINLDGVLTNNVRTGNAQLIPLCYGKINFDGTIISGTGNFSVQKVGVGDYEIYNSAINTNSVAMTTATQEYAIIKCESKNGYIDVSTRLSSSGPYNSGFYFIIYLP